MINLQKLFASTLLAASISAVASGSMAEETEGFSATGSVGAVIFNEDGDLSPTGSIGLGYGLAPNLAIELGYTEVGVGDSVDDGEVDYKHVRLDLLRYYGEQNFQPYAVVGLGNYMPELGDDEVMFNLGVGVRNKLNNWAAFRADIRGLLIDSEDDLNTDIALNVGLQVFFSKMRSSKAAAPKVVAPVTPAADLDSDNDGVSNRFDRCPATAAGKRVDATGCAFKVVYTDSDNDGVPNDLDRCPSTKAGASTDKYGCVIKEKLPEPVSLSIDVKFASNSNTIVSGTEQIAKVADFLNKYSNAKAVIEGHTDSQGSHAHNQNLSELRAQAIVSELVNKFGIDPTKLSSTGYGETRPIKSNDTAAGRAANRRVTAQVSGVK